jgi:hypothetical protein
MIIKQWTVDSGKWTMKKCYRNNTDKGNKSNNCQLSTINCPLR